MAADAVSYGGVLDKSEGFMSLDRIYLVESLYHTKFRAVRNPREVRNPLRIDLREYPTRYVHSDRN